MRALLNLPARITVALLKGYHRWISPMLPFACRFSPSCSVYAIEVISSFGLLEGGFLTLKRLLKCQPFHPGGIDLPPKPVGKKVFTP